MSDLRPNPHPIALKWAERLGGGFHPDTTGADYYPPLSKRARREYDADMDQLFADCQDPYADALAALLTL